MKNQKRQLAVFNTASNTGLDKEDSYVLEKVEGNHKHSAMPCQGKYKFSKKAWHGTPQSIDYGESDDICISVAANFTIKIGRVEAATSSQRNKFTMDIDNNTDTTVLGSNFLTINDFEI